MLHSVVLPFALFLLAGYVAVWILVERAAGRRWGVRGHVVAASLFTAVLCVPPMVMWWATMSSEDDYGPPPLDRITVPASAMVAASDTGCGSGGCWTELWLTPRDGVSPDAMVRDLETAERCTPGSLLDPRPVCWEHRVVGTDAELIASYRRPW